MFDVAFVGAPVPELLEGPHVAAGGGGHRQTAVASFGSRMVLPAQRVALQLLGEGARLRQTDVQDRGAGRRGLDVAAVSGEDRPIPCLGVRASPLDLVAREEAHGQDFETGLWGVLMSLLLSGQGDTLTGTQGR